MWIIIAPDSFKDSLTAREAAEAIARGFRRVFPHAECELIPMADGGEGTVQSLVDATRGRLVSRRVQGPLGDPVDAAFGVFGDGLTAVIEMAAASGLMLVPRDQRDPRHTTTCGTGELIRAALDEGVRRLIVGIGGSATNDGGAGMAQALGARLLDSKGQDIGPGGYALADLDRVDIAGLDARLADVETIVACDVDNPLTGPRGASAVYGPQKGATPEIVRELDANLAHFGSILHRDLGTDVAEAPGSGAAGGLGAGLMAFLGAELRSGIDIVLDTLDFRARIRGATMVITGEGAIDEQTAFGKTPMGVAQAAKEHGIPVFAIAGSVGSNLDPVYNLGIDSVVSLVRGPMTLEAAIRDAAELMEDVSARLARIIRASARIALN